MAEFVVVDKEQLETDLTTVADAIRAKGGTTEPLAFPNGMAKAVEAIPSDSFYDVFWDTFQDYGERQNYSNAFYSFAGTNTNDFRWTEENLRPKYSMAPTRAEYMFFGTKIKDFPKLFEELGITFEGKNLININSIFAYSPETTKVFPLYISNIKSGSNAGSMFRDCVSLESAEVYEIDEVVGNYKIFNLAFNRCGALKIFKCSGTIRNDISFANSSLLTAESAKNVILCLGNHAGTEYEATRTVTFHADTWALLDAEGNASPNGNTWKEYITDIGWLYS